MKAVAFLQNMWVKEPGRARESMARFGRVAVIRRLLFMGCLTGRRLTAAFGEELLERMVFEETTTEIADNPRTIFPVDEGHIIRVIEAQQPAVIVAFGGIAQGGVRLALNNRGFPKVPVIAAPHPAARQGDTVAKLNWAAARVSAVLRPRNGNWVAKRICGSYCALGKACEVVCAEDGCDLEMGVRTLPGDFGSVEFDGMRVQDFARGGEHPTSNIQHPTSNGLP